MTIVIKVGQEFNSELVQGGLSFPQSGWDEHKMEDKFCWLVSHVLDKARTDELAGLAWQFDQVADVRELTNLLR